MSPRDLSDALGPAAARRPRWGAAAVRLAVTAAVLTALLVWLPLAELVSALRQLPPGLWLLAALGFAVGHGFQAAKWGLLLRVAGVAVGARDLVRAHGSALFANLCLPSLVGGDVVRAGWVARRGSLSAVAVVGIADRVLDTTATVLVAALGAGLVPARLDAGMARVLALSALVLALAVPVGIALLRRVDVDRLPARARRPAGRVRQALDALLSRPGTALVTLAIGVAVQGGFVLLNAALGAAVGIEAPVSVWLLAWPLAKLAALAPVSLGGIGVREAALAALLAPFGVPPALAVAQSLIWETVLVGVGIVAGALALWLGDGVAER